eukprot:CAMPEP_0172440110 /NCGR_PEP_ID=MMETSP1065-20121228/870_1 /TAXON_ID=265537 /ORGANISM="Amphiprora paludosa, Strain CCMP125" /LENGTH=119 /DNA_ID=CAMNT_0013188893 /DNA_START=70 /DNA_END=432 /DNA_ORIENTATION=+
MANWMYVSLFCVFGVGAILIFALHRWNHNKNSSQTTKQRRAKVQPANGNIKGAPTFDDDDEESLHGAMVGMVIKTGSADAEKDDDLKNDDTLNSSFGGGGAATFTMFEPKQGEVLVNAI